MRREKRTIPDTGTEKEEREEKEEGEEGRGRRRREKDRGGRGGGQGGGEGEGGGTQPVLITLPMMSALPLSFYQLYCYFDVK